MSLVKLISRASIAHKASTLTVMFSLVFGDEGVSTVTSILRDEMKQNLRLLGATSIKELVPAMVRFVSFRQPLGFIMG